MRFVTDARVARAISDPLRRFDSAEPGAFRRPAGYQRPEPVARFTTAFTLPPVLPTSFFTCS